MGEHKNNPNVLKFLGAGSNQQQMKFDLSQAEKKACPCGHEYFDKVFRMGVISKLAPSNLLNQDITIEYATYVCKGCGLEFGKQPAITQQ